METREVVNKRASLKMRMSAREVEQEKIDQILDAARVAPSARNMQPWRFVVIKDRAVIENLVSAAFSEVNQVVKEAPVIIVACANPDHDIIRDGKGYYLFDVGLAMENIVLTATDLGLVTHLMTGIDEGELKKVLDVPDEVRFVAATPLAYPAEGSYDEAAQERLGQRERKGLKEIVYSNKWAKPFY